MKPFISVIVPVYRVEQYLKKCVYSLLAQTYDNYEILLIDDGSDDNCPRMCDQYGKMDDRVKVFHKKNGGLSDARNYGIQRMQGTHAVFVDSDDYVTNTYLADLAKLVEEYNADIAIIKAIAVNEEGNILEFSKSSGKIEKLSVAEALKRMLYRQGFGVAAWGKIYSKEIIKKYPYPIGIYYEDLATTYKMISNSGLIVYWDKINYYYVQRSGSIIHRKPSEKELAGIDLAEEIIRYMECSYPEVVSAAICRYNAKILEYIPCLMTNTSDNIRTYKFLRSKLLKYYQAIMMDSNISKNTKIRSSAVILGYMPTILVWKSSNFIKSILLRFKY